jgi:hypothetical protein
MGYLDRYGKEELRAAASDAFIHCGPSVLVNYGDSRPCRIDGTVGDRIAVEVESRYAKHIRGAVLDLLVHPYPQKLLILLPDNIFGSADFAYQCTQALGLFLARERFEVILLARPGESGNFERDVESVRAALKELGFSSSKKTKPTQSLSAASESSLA